MTKRLPLAPFGKILKDSDPKIRVSKDAAKEFTELVEDISKDMARDIVQFANHARRKTVIRDDVALLRKTRKNL